VRLDEIGGHTDNPIQEVGGICLAALDLHQGIFPFSGHSRRSDRIRQDGDQVDAVL
jgi:hypothetical protein